MVQSNALNKLYLILISCVTLQLEYKIVFELEEDIMNSSIIKKLLAIVLIGFFSQIALADNAMSAKTIAGILVGLNHFPSDSDKTALMAIAEDDSNGRAYRAVATAVSNIQHGATDADKEILNRIIASDQAPDEVKALAEVVVGLMHSAGADAKETLQALL